MHLKSGKEKNTCIKKSKRYGFKPFIDNIKNQVVYFPNMKAQSITISLALKSIVGYSINRKIKKIFLSYQISPPNIKVYKFFIIIYKLIEMRYDFRYDFKENLEVASGILGKMTDTKYSIVCKRHKVATLTMKCIYEMFQMS